MAKFATPSQLALYEFLKGAGTPAPPHQLPPDCLATLREHERTVDLGDRARRAEQGREGRTERSLELKLAIRGVELKHAVAAKDDAVAQGSALARRLERSRDQRSQLTANLAVANERVATLRKQQQRQERRVADLYKAREQLKSQRDLLQRDVVAAREQFDQARQDRDELSQANTELRREVRQLKHEGAEHRRERDALIAQRLALRKHKEDSALAHASTRSETMALIRQWDAEIARRRVQLAELDEFIGHLGAGTRAWLGSRRWRLGNALVSLARRLTFRRAGAPALPLLEASLDAHQANVATIHQAAKSHRQLLEEMPSATAVAADIDDEVVRAESARAVALNAMLFDRAGALGKLADELAERRRLADELIRLAETLRSSRRWRTGHFLLSLPHHALGRGRPATAADALSGLIGEYRRAAVREPVTSAERPPPSTPRPDVSTPAQDAVPAKRTPLVATPTPTAGPCSRVPLSARSMSSFASTTPWNTLSAACSRCCREPPFPTA